jgi:hypothetical protein
MAFEIWIAILKRSDFLEVTVMNGRIVLNCIFKSSFWNMWTALLCSECGPVMDCSKDTD